MKIIIIVALFAFIQSSMAQKPDLDRAYKFKKVPKISLKNLRIPYSAGKNVYLDIPEISLPSNNKKRGPATSGSRSNKISVSGACTQQNGGIVSPTDPGYDSCLDGSVYVKKVILTDPTQSILMNLNLNGLDLNPF
jgi:hypothetical protein